MTALTDWENFYVIVGSSAGALIGLQFVVVTLIADAPAARRDPQAGNAFGSPSVVHFGVVLLLSALISVPWDGARALCLLWSFIGLAGLVYGFVVVRRMLVQTAYKPVFEDWLFHILCPFGAYAVLAAAGGVGYFESELHRALFLVAASSLLLLFIGIHNAWDAVVFHVFYQKDDEDLTPPKK